MLLCRETTDELPPGFQAYLKLENARDSLNGSVEPANVVPLSREMEYLTDHDILYLNPSRGEVSVLYRRHSNSNTIFLTESCNCRCIMCPQPPRNTDERDWASVWRDAIPLMSPGSACRSRLLA